MRLRRIILAGLTALAAYSYAQTMPDLARPISADSLPRLFHAVVPLFVAAAESASVAPLVKSTPHVVFSLEALMETPFAGSLFLLASFAAIHLYLRRHQRTLLRC